MLEYSLIGRTFQGFDLPETLQVWLSEHWNFDTSSTVKATNWRITLKSLPISLKLGQALAKAPRLELLHSSVGLLAYESTFILGTSASGVQLELHSRGADLVVWGDILIEALHFALVEALRWTGLIPLHAAVVAQGGQATVLLGSSGRGKTTTLLRLLKQGWQPVAEDFSWLEPSSGIIYGWDRGLRLLPDTLVQLGSPLSPLPEPDAMGKVFLSYQQLGYTCRPAHLVRLIVLERSEAAEPALKELRASQAMIELWRASGVPLAPHTQKHFTNMFQMILQKVQLNRLNLGEITVPIKLDCFPEIQEELQAKQEKLL